MSSTYQPPSDPEVSGWALGGISFASVMMILIGILQVVDGISAIAGDRIFVVTPNYTYDLDVTVWGWLHLIIGLLILATGAGLVGRRGWAGIAAVFLLVISVTMNFMLIPFYPFWSLAIIGLDVWVIWALTRPGAVRFG